MTKQEYKLYFPCYTRLTIYISTYISAVSCVLCNNSQFEVSGTRS